MKQKILFSSVVTLFITAAAFAQSDKKVTGYAITAQEKGQSGWKEVRKVDAQSGEVLQTYYDRTKTAQIFNARTGQPIEIKTPEANKTGNFTTITSTSTNSSAPTTTTTYRIEGDKVYTVDANNNLTPVTGDRIKVVSGQKISVDELAKIKEEVRTRMASARNSNTNTNTNTNTNVNVDIAPTLAQLPRVVTNINGTVKTIVSCNVNTNVHTKVIVMGNGNGFQKDKPFATNSAAAAYDRVNDRLYYTPMSIAELRYIDLKTGNIYYYQDEPFGVAGNFVDVPNQITRMAFASDGNGYALTNDGNHLIRFSTGKDPQITDLGPVTDDPANVNISIHSRNGFGGDMVADANGNLYLIMANKKVFRISLETKVATHLGMVKGLPEGFHTNGAMVEDELESTKIIVASSESTVGYFHFDLSDLQATKLSTSQDVFNASDLANGNLLFEKKKEEKKPEVKKEVPLVKEEPPVVTSPEATRITPHVPFDSKQSITVYPNPVPDGGVVKLNFNNYPAGNYEVSLLDMQGQMLNTKTVNIGGKLQTVDFKLPILISKASYLLKVTQASKTVSLTKLVVQ